MIDYSNMPWPHIASIEFNKKELSIYLKFKSGNALGGKAPNDKEFDDLRDSALENLPAESVIDRTEL